MDGNSANIVIGGKMTNYEIDARVPLIISAPGNYAKGKKTKGMVEFVDIYPTLCELAKLNIPTQLEGKSAVPLLKDPQAKGKPYAFTQLLRAKTFLENDTYGDRYMGCSVRNERYRYVEWLNMRTMELDTAELYDHIDDPQENKSIVGNPKYADIITELSAQLAPGWKSIRSDPPQPKSRKK